jgi:hypothetical protein
MCLAYAVQLIAADDLPPKRSKPLSFTPPNGRDWHMYVVAKSLMVDMPASNWNAIDLQPDAKANLENTPQGMLVT